MTEHHPRRKLEEEAWRNHERHAELEKLRHERDAAGKPTWATAWLEEEDDWQSFVFHPVSDSDTRQPITIGRWPRGYVSQIELDWAARLTERDTGDEEPLYPPGDPHDDPPDLA